MHANLVAVALRIDILTNIKIKSPLELCNACNKDFAKVLFALYMDFTLGLFFIDYIATIYESSGNMIAILCIINFLWGLAFFPIFNILKKWVESTKSLPFGAIINFLSDLLMRLIMVCGLWFPLLLIIFFKDLDHGNNALWSALAFFGGLVAYAFLKRNAIKSYVREVHQKSNPYDTPSELAIEIIEKDWRCRKCGTPHKYPYERNSPMYGSPLFICPKCGMEQLAYGRLEPALNRSFGNWNIGRISIKVNVVTFVISVALLILILNIPYSSREFFGILLFFTATIFVSSVIITIESLLKKKPDFIKKSEVRLQDKDYVALLRKHGYEVPHSIRSSK